jgi:hypothetical protein
MKKTPSSFGLLILFVFSIMSCGKRDKINHYLPDPITQQELSDNGFYKYSYTDTIDDVKNKSTNRYITKYKMYSNVRPENKDNPFYPMQLVRFYKSDSVKNKQSIQYIKNQLNNRIITYLFRNDSLFYKNVVVFPHDQEIEEIADLSSEEKIKKYYSDLKIPISIIIEGNRSKKSYPTLFRINNYKTSIYHSTEDKSYKLFVNYINENNFYRNILEHYYLGQKINARYYD